MIRTLLLVEFEPELQQGRSRERFKSVCLYMMSFIGQITLFFEASGNACNKISAAASLQRRISRRMACFLTGSHVCERRCGYQLRRDLALTHTNMCKILTNTLLAAVRSCIDPSLLSFPSFCLSVRWTKIERKKLKRRMEGRHVSID